MTVEVAAAVDAPDEASRAEWHALLERSEKAHKKAEHEKGMVALYMADHLKAGGLAPAAYGIPAEAALVAYRRACEHTEVVERFNAEYAAVREIIAAHPFQLHLDRIREDKDAD